ncbi:pentapeptide repeat-containing protein [Nocardia carnea]|uniref:Pentapeptide repeat-containing protein n=1 Tax=Nocardia carnea TaxID=37328 RepID=A0ABW7TZG6_9NOCA|nr:pentapeptide repeat-containing protein [Nocardia carnea]
MRTDIQAAVATAQIVTTTAGIIKNAVSISRLVAIFGAVTVAGTASGAFTAIPDLTTNGINAALASIAAMAVHIATRADFSRSDLRKVQASGCVAEGAVFREAQMQGAVFEDANLRSAIFYGANLHSADFNGADLSGSDLRNCNVGSADFGSSRLAGSMVEGAHGSLFGPIDVGGDAGLLNGDELQDWFTARGAAEVRIRSL